MKKFFAILAGISMSGAALATDHNEPDPVNSIFGDVQPDAADLYGVFGFPVRGEPEERVAVLMSFSPAPNVNEFDPDVLHRIYIAPSVRLKLGDLATNPVTALKDTLKLTTTLTTEMISGLDQENSKYPEIRVTYAKNAAGESAARLEFRNFLKGPGVQYVKAGETTTWEQGNSPKIKMFVGGRDDPFFTDLGGFFRSIHYLPAIKPKQSIKTNPKEGDEVKSIVVMGENKNHIKRNEIGVMTVYKGVDSRAKYNVNAIAVEIPVSFLTTNPAHRVIRVWGEGYRRKASHANLIGENP